MMMMMVMNLNVHRDVYFSLLIQLHLNFGIFIHGLIVAKATVRWLAFVSTQLHQFLCEREKKTQKSYRFS